MQYILIHFKFDQSWVTRAQRKEKHQLNLQTRVCINFCFFNMLLTVSFFRNCHAQSQYQIQWKRFESSFIFSFLCASSLLEIRDWHTVGARWRYEPQTFVFSLGFPSWLSYWQIGPEEIYRGLQTILPSRKSWHFLQVSCTSLLYVLLVFFISRHAFATFDANNDGTIDFDEFILAIAASNQGNLDDRLELAFDM